MKKIFELQRRRLLLRRSRGEFSKTVFSNHCLPWERKIVPSELSDLARGISRKRVKYAAEFLLGASIKVRGEK